MREILKKFVAGNADIIFARLSVIIVLAVMGNYKWFEFEVEALKPLFFADVAFVFAVSARGCRRELFFGRGGDRGLSLAHRGLFQAEGGHRGRSHRDRHGADYAQPTAAAGQDRWLYL